METIMEMDEFNTYPIEAQKWEIAKTSRKLVYLVKKLQIGDVFGYEEMITNEPRKTQVYSISTSEVIYISKKEFFYRKIPQPDLVQTSASSTAASSPLNTTRGTSKT